MSATPTITARQLWGQGNTRTTSAGTREWCTPVILPTGGILVVGENSTTTLTARATYLLPCDSDESVLSPDTTGNSTVIGFYEPFYASISPQIFALATATVISYILVILIFITPRTFYVGGPGGGGGFLSRHGLSSSKSIVGVGRRPLLQKIATITVAISLTIAAADTFSVAEDQYSEGYLDSSALVDDVVNTVLIKVVRIISDSFLWLAQVQTLIRLFPRHKEKVTIKWLGFALVSADIIFSILDSFISDNPGTRPRSFQDAIPALNYLFELAISLIYASCVVYYSLSKRRFAFWHPKMRNVCLVALISLISVLIPVVFFVLDISLPRLAGWGEYIRWVGAAAASVVVWEWVERIEALERDERKDGILGREMFDGDEMLDRPSSDDSDWHGRGNNKDGRDVEKSAGLVQRVNQMRSKLPLRRRRKRPAGHNGDADDPPPSGGTGTNVTTNPLVPPQPAVSPPSRSDTASAASTVYAVRYHNLTSPSPGAPEPVPENTAQEDQTAPKEISDSSTEDPPVVKNENDDQIQPDASRGQQFWSTVPNPFKRRKAEPPAEVAGAQAASGLRRSPIDRTINLRDRLGAFAAAQRDRFGRNGSGPIPPLPVMVIPAPKQNDRTWSPDEVRNSSSTSSAGQPRGEEAGSSGHLQQTFAGNQNDDNVVVIPAPARGQTWSPPEQAESSGQTHGSPSAQQRGHGLPSGRSDTSNTPTPTPTPTPNVISTPRGALTIEEDSGRTQQSVTPRRNTYTRRSAPRAEATVPTSQSNNESDAADTAGPAKPSTVRGSGTQGHGPAGDGQKGTQNKQAAGAELEQQPSASAGSGRASPSAHPAQQKATEEAAQSTSPQQSPEDGRDTGGTSPGTST
ncbi:uncharacterized protein HMPREF1541_10002 [Cyphellophora europaea CBS 101466]|uniref:PH-response regulator protein palH/RIM21 n=1 Tax=Cyphellophora europaea (strain CBS 101466) TaxID=1220924 RepID=W2S906_CYPE1|nr:uncharacterized protein HMPREF1541_10002 [Cyphellophora europaea CBS 101466]ETN45125.1 hypothetical protein HMPREF1541_10002 [Cyphellophora europaea CBS 101466]